MTRLEDLREKYPIVLELDPQPFAYKVTYGYSDRFNYLIGVEHLELFEEEASLEFRPRPEYAQDEGNYRVALVGT